MFSQFKFTQTQTLPMFLSFLVDSSKERAESNLYINMSFIWHILDSQNHKLICIIWHLHFYFQQNTSHYNKFNKVWPKYTSLCKRLWQINKHWWWNRPWLDTTQPKINRNKSEYIEYVLILPWGLLTAFLTSVWTSKCHTYTCFKEQCFELDGSVLPSFKATVLVWLLWTWL